MVLLYGPPPGGRLTTDASPRRPANLDRQTDIAFLKPLTQDSLRKAPAQRLLVPSQDRLCRFEDRYRPCLLHTTQGHLEPRKTLEPTVMEEKDRRVHCNVMQA
ncbi:hypothetical protein HRR83_007730 [Exophiala dermatitidis]|uniref:Uncharacterized protein n=1 Tax=Exophiala dermatitidis TaxID=5970 RepID=A0AAN6ERN4_EXODE|nr:hypothetical protein HRR73_008900 [Exophiala dermatitidis]KAJ4509880.1 hypothetical protein HRR74_007032 [Exophiala dermatitidis]KAJ4539568.1 hypothetical protein HRR77_006447 [Exophiala dermatitidis]KAJ4548351.1 hypothetical protein HRR76_000957 [Exophiala dermatitidis]KAJ4562992.1 hypothetical protein HRR79_006580 [Exophiala dermatitidis]